MTRFTIIWDFDGTLLPSDPFDSEQTLLLDLLNDPREQVPLIKRIVARAIVFLDRRKWMGPAFKRHYAWVLSGTPMDRLDPVSERLASKIPETDRHALRQLHGAGHAMGIISCGTFDLIARTMDHARLTPCFEEIVANRLLFTNGRITGIEKRILHPADKLKPLRARAADAARVIGVGDGYTDLPLLDWVGFPVLMNRARKKGKPPLDRPYPEIASVSELFQWIDIFAAKKGARVP